MIRKPFQGVLNIIRFNWHFYVMAIVLVVVLVLVAGYFSKPLPLTIYLICIVISGSTFISLLTSIYIYDLSGLYELKWIDQQNSEKIIVNINAGFDETSELLQTKFKKAELIALDFYDPKKHTEVSIKRAREAYPPFPKTKQIQTSDLQLESNSADKIFVILSAHEIRDENERITFFKELTRVIKPSGQIYVTEHLRDANNFFAYTIGFFHFYSKGSWVRIFKNAELTIQREIKLTPFISTFILTKNGNTY